MSKITREEFMKFFRSDDFQDHMGVSDYEEIFMNILKGSSDITPELLTELCKNYDVELEIVKTKWY